MSSADSLHGTTEWTAVYVHASSNITDYDALPVAFPAWLPLHSMRLHSRTRPVDAPLLDHPDIAPCCLLTYSGAAQNSPLRDTVPAVYLVKRPMYLAVILNR